VASVRGITTSWPRVPYTSALSPFYSTATTAASGSMGGGMCGGMCGSAAAAASARSCPIKYADDTNTGGGDCSECFARQIDAVVSNAVTPIRLQIMTATSIYVRGMITGTEVLNRELYLLTLLVTVRIVAFNAVLLSTRAERAGRRRITSLETAFSGRAASTSTGRRGQRHNHPVILTSGVLVTASITAADGIAPIRCPSGS